MSLLEVKGATIHYEVRGSGFPLLLFAPGGMNSVAQMWRERPERPGEPLPWIDPPSELSEEFMVIAMDQRNAGASSGSLSADDGWHTYTADHLALLDHLEVERTHLMGGCIGCSYALSLCEAAPERVAAAVLQNPIGLTATNRPAFFAMFDMWAQNLQRRRHDVTDDALASMRHHMFGGDFVFSVSRDFVRSCTIPLLVLAGNDEFHPTEVAREIAELAPDAQLVLEWGGPEHHDATLQRIREFLGSHTPASA
jgi:pimeloyl-ACP methyl ester carboxylesterase